MQKILLTALAHEYRRHRPVIHRQWTMRRWRATPPSAPRPNPRVARLLHEGDIRRARGTNLALGVEPQHHLPAYTSPLLEVQCSCMTA
jgi:hypothetical protein